MSDSVFSRAKDVLGQVVDLPVADQARAVQTLCDGDAALADEVRSLLAHCAEPDRRLAPAGGARALLGSLLGEGADGTSLRVSGVLAPGVRVGGFVLGQRLGAGGMGVVFEARQDDPPRTVALKIVAGGGPVSPEVARRFRQEVHVLGRLDHPGIAALYEAGALQTDDGLRPFFVMQRVHGQRLDRWLAAHEATTEQVVQLLAAVCDAVHHAHERGVVHRDLKPANLLVDEHGRPTVLDFGVARLDEAQTQVTSLHTEVGSLLGTLPYMSPEQVGGAVGELGPRSDVYALGVLLFEALTGQLPLPVAGLSVPAAALVIQRDDPPRLGDLVPGLSGDLETVVDTALAKEPERRYADAGALAADLRRWLEGRAVAAKRLSTGQQMLRFVRRHRALTAGVSVAFVSLVVALLVSLEQTSGAQRARDLALREADRSKVIAAAAALDAGEPLAALEQLQAVTDGGRGWEWHYHRQRLESESARWDVGADLAVAGLGADGSVVEVASDGRLRRRRPPEPVAWEQRRLVEEGELRQICLDRPSRRLAAVHVRGEQHELLLTELDSGRELARLPVDGATRLLGLSADGRSLAWLLDRQLELWHEDDAGRVTRHALELGEKSVRAEGFQKLKAVVQGTRVAFLGQFGVVSLIDVSQPIERAVKVRVSGERPNSAAWLRDGSALAVGVPDGSILVVDGRTGETLARLAGHRGPVLALDALPGDGRLVSLGHDQTLRSWDLGERRQLDVRCLRDVGAQVFCAAVEQDLVLLGDRDVLSLFDLGASARADVLAGHEGYVYDVDVLADGTVVSASWDRSVRFWRPGEVLVRRFDERVSLVEAAPDSPLVVARSGSELWLLGPDGAEPRWLSRQAFQTQAAAWSADGARVYSLLRNRGEQGHRVPAVWDVATGEELAAAPGGERSWTRFALPPSEEWLVVSGRTGELTLLELPGWRELHQLDGHSAHVEVLALSADGRLLVSGDVDGRALLWDLERRMLLHELGEHPGTIWDAAFTPDGSRVATACHDGIIRLFDVSDGQLVTQLRGHQNYVKGLAFSPDGSFLASASGDRTVRVWHTRPLALR